MLDSSKLRKTLGWDVQVGLDTGLDQCIAWVRKNLEEMKTMHWDYLHKP